MKAICFCILMLTIIAGSKDSFSQDAIKYAPQRKPVSGVLKVICVGVKFKNEDKFVDKGKCKSMANQVNEFYRRNSRGVLTMKTSSDLYESSLNGSKTAYKKAVDAIKGKYSADIYMIPNHHTGSHASGKVAYLKGSLYRDSQHEVGHLLGLGHAGSYKLEKGKLSLDHYADGHSVMGRFPSSFLTAPQYYHMGWTTEKEVAIYELGKTYELKRVTSFQESGLAAVIVNPTHYAGSTEELKGSADKQRKLWISFPPECNACIAMHLSNGGSSQRLKMFGNEYHDKDFTGIKVKVLGFNNGKIKISIETLPK